MKRLNRQLFFALILIAASCTTSKSFTDEEKKMRVPDDPMFVVKTNGEKVSGSKLSTAGVFSTTAWVKLDGTKYAFDELQKYQDRHSYYAKFNNVWAKQLKRGKISLYYYETSTPEPFTGPDHHTTYVSQTHFVFQKGDGPLQELSLTAISELLSDNREARDKFDAQFHPGQKWLPKQMQNHPKVVFDVVDMYNNG